MNLTASPIRSVALGGVALLLALLACAPVSAQTPPLPFEGELPSAGGVALVATSLDATPEQLITTATSLGCDASSIWVGGGGTLTGYVAGAPDFVNAGFPGNVPTGTPLLIVCAPPQPATMNAPGLSCPVFPADNIWNTRVDDLPVHAQSSAWVATIGASATMHPDFGSGVWPPDSDTPIGIPYVEVDGVAGVSVSFEYDSESDHGPYPIPSNAPIEGGPSSSGDRHVLVVDRSHCTLYELFAAYPQSDGSWTAGSGAIYDLNSNALRPSGWTSADAAGLPILAGLVRYDEVAAGEIGHALRFTAPQTQRAFVWPARHYASSFTGAEYPPMGARFRLRADFDVSGYDAEVQVILRALQRYGMILADNGSSWYLSGAPDERWDNEVLRQLKDLQGSDFEAVDSSSLIASVGSGAVSR